MLVYVPLSQIDDNPYQARQEYGDVAELAGRIAAARDNYPDTFGLMQIPRGRAIFRNAAHPHGVVLSPAKALTMTDKDRVMLPDTAVRVELAFGHRRLRAFRHLWANQEPGYTRGVFPIHIDALTDEQMLDAVWSENRERKDISAVEEAELLQRKLERSKSQREVAEAWGVDRSTVANRLRLLDLPPEIQQANRDGRLSERACLALTPVLKVQAAGVWPKSYYAPTSPADYVSELLANPNGTTSEDIRKYAERAIKHAGTDLPGFVATFETGVSGPIRQSTCKGCPFRINATCLDAACLAAKEAVVVECVLDDAAEELNVQISDREEDFVWYTNSPKELRALWKSGGQREGTNFVIRWQPSDSAVRPFSEREYIWHGDQRYDNDGRAGIALGHRGNLPLHLIPDEDAQPAEDIASRTDRHAWSEEAKKLSKAAEQMAKKALVDALYMPADGAADVIQALMCDPDKAWIDEYEKLLKEFVAFMWDRGRGANAYYNGWKHVQVVRSVLSRAGLNPDKLLTTGSTDGDLRRDAVLVLDFWYDRRDYGQYDWPECQKALTAVLARWPIDTDGDLMDLRYELLRAQRDMDAKIAANQAAKETRLAAEAAQSLAEEEDADLYDEEE
ncbi:MAG: hypothetical protein H6661_09965 [Ardenticatenaceae bacterium]|nr:hypothetical protein [Ardenticatenaceae bacterium]